MSYKISGNKNSTARVMIINEGDWSIEYNSVISGSGDYEITSLASGNKTVIGRNTNGLVVGYGAVQAELVGASPVLHYTFDDISGTTVPDQIGSKDATIYGTKDEETGNVGTTALRFATDSDYLLTTSLTNNDSAGTVSFWFKLDSVFSSANSDHQHVFCYYESDADRITLRFDSGSGKLRFIHYTGTDTSVYSEATSWNAGQWYHIMIVHTGTQTSMYVDNVLQTGAVSDTKWLDEVDGDLYLGIEYFKSSIQKGLKGTIDDFRIYDEAIDSDDRTALFEMGITSGPISGGDRGLFGGGYLTSSNLSEIDYVTISTTGNAQDFGDITVGRNGLGACSNGGNDRGLFTGGQESSYSNIIDYVTISNLGNATDFGDMTVARWYVKSTDNGTNDRGVIGPGSGETSTMDYVTISTTGNATDFGDVTVARDGTTAQSNDTNNRGLFMGGNTTDIIEYITITSAGNATDFGDLTVTRDWPAGCSNGVNDRAVCISGRSGSDTDVMDYVTISTTGNASDFGDIATPRRSGSGTSNTTNERGLVGGGTDGTNYNIIDYITINSTGNTTDFGDLTQAKKRTGATSNS